MNDEEKKEYEELKSLLYTGTISQYGKRKLIDMFEKQQKEIEELKKPKYIIDFKTNEITTLTNDFVSKDKIKAKIEEIENEDKKYKNYLKDGRENFTPEYVWARPVLQSLLEKE